MMKLLIGIILAYVLGVTLLGAWHGLGPMEKIWAIAFVAVLASLLIPALRPLAARVLILIVIVFFLVNLYGKAVSAYHAAAGNLRATASYLALDAWQTGKKWVGSLLPSIGTGTAVDMAERARAADAAYVQCLGNVIAEQAGQGLISPANRQYANTCLAQASPDEACMRIVLGWIQENDPSQGQRCVQGNVLGRARAGTGAIANVLCARWLPESVQNIVCVDRWNSQTTQTGAAPATDSAYRYDPNRANCLLGVVSAQGIAAFQCNEFRENPQRWEQCVIDAIRGRLGSTAQPYLRQCGAAP